MNEETAEVKKTLHTVYLLQMIAGFVEGTVFLMAGVCCLMSGVLTGYISGILLCIAGMASLFVIFHPERKIIMENQTANVLEGGTFFNYCEETDRMIEEKEKNEE